MDRWSLRLRSKELEQEYSEENNQANFKIMRIFQYATLLSCLIQLALVYAKGTYPFIVALYYISLFSVSAISILICYINLNYFNISIFFSIIAQSAIVAWTNINPTMRNFFLTDETFQAPLVRGFFFSTMLYGLLIGSNLQLKVLAIVLYMSVIIYTASWNIIADIVKLTPFVIAFAFKIFTEDRSQRSTFLIKKKEHIWDHIVDTMLPSSLILVKFNDSTGRFELFSQNKKAREEFGFKNTDHFNNFSQHVVLQPDSDSKKMQQILAKCRKPSSENTLYGQVRIKLNKEIENRGLELSAKKKQKMKLSIKDKLKQKISNVFNLKSDWNFNLIPVFTDQIQKDKKFTQESLSQKAIDSLLHNKESEKKTIDNFEGHMITEHFSAIPNKSYSVKIITFFLNDYFAVISIQKENFKEKYLSLVDNNTKSAKIYQGILNSLNKSTVENFSRVTELQRAPVVLDPPQSKHKQLIDTFTFTLQSEKVQETNIEQLTQQTIKSNQISSLLYSCYSAQQDVFNLIEWMHDRSEKLYKERYNNFSVDQILQGLKTIFSSILKDRGLQIDISTCNGLQLNTDQRVLSQILFNIIRFAVEKCGRSHNKNNIIKLDITDEPKGFVRFQVTFTSSTVLNRTYLNWVTLEDDQLQTSVEFIGFVIAKYIFNHINPNSRMVIDNVNDWPLDYIISFTVPTDKINRSLKQLRKRNSQETLYQQSSYPNIGEEEVIYDSNFEDTAKIVQMKTLHQVQETSTTKLKKSTSTKRLKHRLSRKLSSNDWFTKRVKLLSSLPESAHPHELKFQFQNNSPQIVPSFSPQEQFNTPKLSCIENSNGEQNYHDNKYQFVKLSLNNSPLESPLQMITISDLPIAQFNSSTNLECDNLQQNAQLLPSISKPLLSQIENQSSNHQSQFPMKINILNFQPLQPLKMKHRQSHQISTRKYIQNSSTLQPKHQ